MRPPIFVAVDVVETPGGLLRALCRGLGEERRSDAVYWRTVDAWRAAAGMRAQRVAELRAMGYTVAL